MSWTARKLVALVQDWCRYRMRLVTPCCVAMSPPGWSGPATVSITGTALPGVSLSAGITSRSPSIKPDQRGLLTLRSDTFAFWPPDRHRHRRYCGCHIGPEGSRGSRRRRLPADSSLPIPRSRSPAYRPPAAGARMVSHRNGRSRAAIVFRTIVRSRFAIGTLPGCASAISIATGDDRVRSRWISRDCVVFVFKPKGTTALIWPGLTNNSGAA